MNIDKIASIADIALGAWLLVSMLLWRDSPVHPISTAIVGVGAVVLGFMAYRGLIWARWIVGGLAVWLLLEMRALPETHVATVVNHLTVGTLMFGFSVLPTGRGRATGEYPA